MTEPVKKAKAAPKPRKAAKKKEVSKKEETPIKTAKKAPKKMTATAPSHDEIARVAHEFWVERGHAHGSEREDWAQAEAKLRSAKP